MALTLLLAACASIGRPEGGARDMLPPVYVSSDPAPGALNFNGNKITVTFNENIQLEDPVNKVIVSPPLSRQPAISSNGRRVTLQLRDTLQPNTTYTIDFADAVRDLNEGNILDGFAIDFSTGAMRDTLSISGMVFEARTLEPAQEMLVGVYADSLWADTTLRTVRPSRVTKTNALGQFTIRNLADGDYRVVAFNDVDRNFLWNRAEDIAVYPVSVHTGMETVLLPDSLRTGNDSTMIRYTPDNLLLTWSNENYSPAYLVKYERPERDILEMIFSTPAQTLAEIKHASKGEWQNWAAVEAGAALDTVKVWLKDAEMIKSDSLTLSVSYMFTDSLEQLVPKTEELIFAYREKRKKVEKTAKTDTVSTAPEVKIITLSAKSGGQIDLRNPIVWESPTPIATINPDALHLEIRRDTVWQPVEVVPDFTAPAQYRPRTRQWKPDRWEPGAKYKLTIDSLGVTDIYGTVNKPLTYEFSTRSPEDYSALYVNVHGLDSLPAIVELLENDNPSRTMPVIDGLASLTDITPGTYYLRLYIDRNANGEWDAGSPLTDTQPEDVVYYNKKLTLRKNWDVEVDWDIYALPVDEQKPSEIKKNKPPRPKWETETPATTEPEPDEQWDLMSRDPFFRHP